MTQLQLLYNAILDLGLSAGPGKMTVDHAILTANPGYDPSVAPEGVWNFMLALNDANWSSPAARANGLRALGLQIATLGLVDDAEFTRQLVFLAITEVLPVILRKEGFETYAAGCAAAKNMKEAAEAAHLASETGRTHIPKRGPRAAADYAAHAAYNCLGMREGMPRATTWKIAVMAAAAGTEGQCAQDTRLLHVAAIALEIMRNIKSSATLRLPS